MILERLWRDGGGFGPRPITDDPGNDHGVGFTRRIRTGVGPDLVERIDDGDWPTAFTYRVVNPGWRTFPVRWHRGEVRLTPEESGVTGPITTVTWTVRFEPLPAARLPATLLTLAVIARYLRVLADDPA